MPQINVPSTPSLETPHVPAPELVAFLNAVKDHDSLYQAYLKLGSLGERLQAESQFLRSKGFNITDTVKALRDPMASGAFELLHALPKSVIHSIVCGTVAYDAVNSNADFYRTPNLKLFSAPGIYAIGLSVENDALGRFLTEKETNTLVHGIQRYVDGCKVVHRVPLAAQRTAAQKTQVEWVRKVDSAYKDARWTFDETKPLFCHFVRDTSKLESLIAMYRRRCMNRGLAPYDDVVRQLQSPLYVGCSKDLLRRFSEYHIDHMGKFNKNSGITMSICKLMGVPLKMVQRVIMRTWGKGHIRAGEQLATTLADSLGCYSGFNAKEAGDSPHESSDPDLCVARGEIAKSATHLLAHIQASLAEMAIIAECLEKLENGRDLIADSHAHIALLCHEIEEVRSMKDWAAEEQRIQQGLEAIERKAEGDLERHRQLGVIAELMQFLGIDTTQARPLQFLSENS
jgi:hypothetical protein